MTKAEEIRQIERDLREITSAANRELEVLEACNARLAVLEAKQMHLQFRLEAIAKSQWN